MNDSKTALFTNFSNDPFTGYWNGKGKTFQPGQSIYMPDYLAQHFAKHLTNRELLRTKPDGTPIYKDGEKMTSPKRPEDMPIFMELFNKAYTPDEDVDNVTAESDSIDTQIDVANKNREKRDGETGGTPSAPQKERQDANEPQIILPPSDDEDEDDSFQGAPVETQSNASHPGIGL